jgi:4-amino-4-deoxy-L-arabinose transferase-like glycosyltransferase
MRPAAGAIRSRLPLIVIFGLALFLRLFRLGLDGLGNLYYAATVQSMLTGWHNFFFAAFDPAGFVSVDKPPLGFWIQALSVTLFGFHGWALILPQALAGALTVLVLYVLVRRVFGVEAGLIAALILAVTPISVATHRSNTPDGQLLLLLVAAALFASKAAESGKLKWLAASAALVGIGFNVKMMQAYLAAPTLFLFLPSPLPLLKRLGQLTEAMLIMLSLSLAWPLAVDLTPASQRPYVGSTITNHVMELAAVHNGVRRLGPIAGWLGIHEKGSAAVGAVTAPTSTPPQDPNSTSVWPDGGFAEVGNPGPLRLFNPQLAAQASWLLPLAVLALISGIRRTSWKQPFERKAIFFILWAGWLFSMIFFFSFGGLIHRYYLDMLAPPIAALSAVGLTIWKEDFCTRRAGGWLLPAAVGMTILVSLFFLGYYPEMKWLTWPFLGLGGGSVLALILLRSRLGDRSSTAIVLTVILLPLLLWSTTPMWKGGDVILPFAGPDLAYWGGKGSVMEENEPLAASLMDQYDGERFIAATENAVAAAPLQLLTRKPVMAMGGFTGVDPIRSLEELASMTARGEVRFFLVHHEDPITSERIAWLAKHCALLEGQAGIESTDLYDCKGR